MQKFILETISSSVLSKNVLIFEEMKSSLKFYLNLKFGDQYFDESPSTSAYCLFPTVYLKPIDSLNYQYESKLSHTPNPPFCY